MTAVCVITTLALQLAGASAGCGLAQAIQETKRSAPPASGAPGVDRVDRGAPRVPTRTTPPAPPPRAPPITPRALALLAAGWSPTAPEGPQVLT